MSVHSVQMVEVFSNTQPSSPSVVISKNGMKLYLYLYLHIYKCINSKYVTDVCELY